MNSHGNKSDKKTVIAIKNKNKVKTKKFSPLQHIVKILHFFLVC